jgi:hypothetical protein
MPDHASLGYYQEIRETRNLSTGHPTQVKRKKETHHGFIVRAGMSKAGFDLLTDASDGSSSYTRVSVPALINDQRSYVGDILAAVVTKLEEEEEAHKRGFCMEKLAAIFSGTLSYHISKIYEGITRPEEANFTKLQLEYIAETVRTYEGALAKREIERDTYDSIKYLLDELDFALATLREFFGALAEGNEPTVSPKLADIVTFFVAAKVKELQATAQDLDDYYAS